MGLSSELISEFVKVTNDKSDVKTATTVRGETVMYNGKMYVRLDGSDLLTPVDTTTKASDGDRVTVVIENHTATVTGNLSSPSATTGDVEKVASQVTEFEIVMAYKVTTEDLEATNAIIQSLRANAALIGKLEAISAEIDNLEAKYANIQYVDAETIKALTADIEHLEARFGEFTDLSAEDLEAVNADITNLKAYNANFTYVSADVLEAIKANIKELEVKKLSAESADLKYASIDFANIGEAAVKKIFAEYGIIDELVISEGTVVKELVGVTIKGDLIEANTLKVDRLVVKGSDGNYYALNTNFDGLEGVTPVEEDAIHGSVMVANSITAEKIRVEDLVAFDATIGGFHISDNSIYSGVKGSAENTTRGIYLDNDGQIAFGDESNYLKYYKLQNGDYCLAIAASSITMSASGKSVETIVEEVEQKVDNIEVGGRNLLIRKNVVGGYIWSEGFEYSGDGKTGDLTTDWIDISGCKNVTITLYDSFTNDANIGRYALYDSDKNLVTIDEYNPRTPNSVTVQVPERAVYLRATLIDCLTYRYKIEKGNVSTDYTEAPEDANSDIEVGGRNLLIKKNLIPGYIDFVMGTWDIYEDSLGIASTTDWINISDCKNITITSYDACNNPSSTPDVDGTPMMTGCLFAYDQSSASGIDSVLIDLEKPGYVTITKPEGASYMAVTLFETDRCRYKIEKGNVSTDYTEAPEDSSSIEIGGRNYLRNSEKEQTSPDEFLKTTFDLAPVFDEYGLIEVTLSFDAYSDVPGQVTVYCQNGGGAKYRIDNVIDITTEWKRYSMTVTPEKWMDHETEAFLALYGEYGTGRIPHIRKAKLEKGNVVTDWTPAPEDSEFTVGGRNLLLDSARKIEGDDYQLGAYLIANPGQIVAGDTYTISFDGAMNEDIHTGFYINIYPEPWPTLLELGDIQFKNGRYYGTFVMPEVSTTTESTPYYQIGVYMQPFDHNTLGGSVWNIKLEKGNVATDWTPAPEDVDKSIEDAATVGHTAYAEAHNAQNAANNANDRLDNMSIGGRNFIRNSAFLDGSLHWSFNKTECCEASLDTQRTRHGHPSVRIRGCDTHMYRGLGCYDNFDANTYPMKDLQVGDTVTLSFWYFCEDASTIDNGFAVNLEGMRADGSNGTFGFKSIHHGAGEIVSGEWTRYELTATADDNYTAVGCYVYLIQNGVVWVTDFKLEKGNVATDWTPATEDMASAENLIALTTTVTQYQSDFNQSISSIRASVAKVETTTKSIDGVKQSVERLTERVDVLVDEEKVQFMVKEQLDGHEIKSITTETGYTFDRDGLSISKSNSAFETTITENGMTVTHNDGVKVETMLSATSTGVDARNLHARTYLIVGTNSRFEDYGNNRTGCFWIGN